MLTTEISIFLKFSGGIASYYLLWYFSVVTELIVCLFQVLNRPSDDIVAFGWVM